MKIFASCLLAVAAIAAPVSSAVAEDPPKVERTETERSPDDKIMIGEAEHVHVSLIDSTFKARIDTGATTTSIFATDVEMFERDGDRWVRFTIRNDESGESHPLEERVERVAEIKKRGEDGFTKRPAVLMDLTMGDATRRIAVNLADRTGFEYPLLIGRDFLAGLAIVDVTLSYTQATPGAPEKEAK